MACYHPLTAYQTSDRSIVWREQKGIDVVRQLSLPCGQCVGCRLERSRQWAIRCMHEASLHDQNCFITLTYSDEHVPKDMSLHYEHFQLFMKRLRKKYPDKRIRFYMAGEYGEKFDRPHFHACIFGFDFPDKKYFRRLSSGSHIYRSQDLEGLWPYGYSSIGDVNFQSAAYVARYIMKKINGKPRLDKDGNWIDPEDHYRYCDLETGELMQRTPEFNKMSLKPGIGFNWYKKYMTDVYPHDYVIVNGKKCKPPRYYDKNFEKDLPDEFEMLQFARELEARSRYEDNTPDRLAVKEQVTLAKLSKLKRTI